MSKVTEPRIYTLSRPQLDIEALADFLRSRALNWTPSEGASAAEHLVEVAGRTCYMSFSENTEKIRYPNKVYIQNLIQKGHESVLEHASWTFIFDGVSRAFTHQLVRHRVGFAFSQLSQQYHDESSASFIQPAGLDEESGKVWRDATEEALKTYRTILEHLEKDSQSGPESKRQIRSAARSLLPNATETTIVVSANARAIRHFLNVRGAIVGDIEMRLVCARLLSLVLEDAPSFFFDFQSVAYEDGWPITWSTSKEKLDCN